MKFMKDSTTKYGETLIIGDLLRLEEDTDGRVSIRATGAGGTGILLDDLTDVIISSPTTDQFLRYNGTNWVNQLITAANVGAGIFKTGTFTFSGTVNYTGGQIIVSTANDPSILFNVGAAGGSTWMYATNTDGTPRFRLQRDGTIAINNLGLHAGDVNSSPTNINLIGATGAGTFIGTSSTNILSLSRAHATNVLLPSKTAAVQITGDDSSGGAQLNNPPNIALIAPEVGISADQNQSDAKLELISSRSTIAQLNAGTFTAVVNGDQLGEIRFGGDDGVNIRSQGARIIIRTSATWTNTSHPANIYLATVASGSVGNALDRWVIDSTGALIAINTPGIISADGTAAIPSLAFASETNMGIYRFVAGGIGLTIGGSRRYDFSLTAFNPTVTGSIPLGQSTLRWGKYWGNDADFALDIKIGSLGTFDSTSTPSTDNLLSYNGTKWVARYLQPALTTGQVVSTNLVDNTAATYVNDGRAVAGTPTAPTGAPIITAHYRAIIVDMSAYGALPSDKLFVLDYSTNGGGYTTNAIISSSNKIVHSNLLPANTYAYKYKIRGATDSTYSTATSALSPSNNSEVNAFGVIVASQIAVANLSAINVSIGDIAAGQARNPGNTAGILFSGTLPGTWTRYVNFTATGANPVFKHELLSLNADGTAIFNGFLDVTATGLQTYGTFAKHAIRVHDTGVAHGITDILPTDAFGLIGGDPTTADGGFIITGIAVSTTIEALGLYGLQVTGSTTKAAVALVGAKKSGTSFGALASTEKVFGVWNNNTELISVFGDGKTVFVGALDVAGVSTLRNNLIFNADNSFDIGASGATRPRNVYIAGNLTYGGTLTGTGIAKVLFQDSNKTTTSTSDVSVTSFSLPAGTLAVDNQTIRITGTIHCDTGGSTIKLKFGATQIFSFTLTSANNASFTCNLVRQGATSQWAAAVVVDDAATTLTTHFAAAPTATLSGAITIDFRGNVLASGTLTYEFAQVEFLST